MRSTMFARDNTAAASSIICGMLNHSTFSCARRYLLWPKFLPNLHEFLIIVFQLGREKVHGTIAFPDFQNKAILHQNA
jgi:hypothetical protein